MRECMRTHSQKDDDKRPGSSLEVNKKPNWCTYHEGKKPRSPCSPLSGPIQRHASPSFYILLSTHHRPGRSQPPTEPAGERK